MKAVAKSSRLQGKVALVTGGARGIGRSIVECFVREGAAVVIADIDFLTAEKVALEFSAISQNVHAVHCDVTSPEMIDSAISSARSKFGDLNVLVNNAGINSFNEPLATSKDTWDSCIRTDLESAWLCSKAVLPTMIAAKSGSIIMISSTHAEKVIPKTFPYPVAKHALLGLTRSLAIEYARSGVRVNAISPGYVDTSLLQEYWETFDDREIARQKTLDMIPVGRVCQPEEIGAVAVLLASDEATFMTGSNIVIDGGRSILYHE